MMLTIDSLVVLLSRFCGFWLIFDWYMFTSTLLNDIVIYIFSFSVFVKRNCVPSW